MLNCRRLCLFCLLSVVSCSSVEFCQREHCERINAAGHLANPVRVNSPIPSHVYAAGEFICFDIEVLIAADATASLDGVSLSLPTECFELTVGVHRFVVSLVSPRFAQTREVTFSVGEEILDPVDIVLLSPKQSLLGVFRSSEIDICFTVLNLENGWVHFFLGSEALGTLQVPDAHSEIKGGVLRRLPAGNFTFSIVLSRDSAHSSVVLTKRLFFVVKEDPIPMQSLADDEQFGTAVDCTRGPFENVFHATPLEVGQSLSCLRACTFHNICYHKQLSSFVIIDGPNLHLGSDIWEFPLPSLRWCNSNSVSKPMETMLDAWHNIAAEHAYWIGQEVSVQLNIGGLPLIVHLSPGADLLEASLECLHDYNLADEVPPELLVRAIVTSVPSQLVSEGVHWMHGLTIPLETLGTENFGHMVMEMSYTYEALLANSDVPKNSTLLVLNQDAIPAHVNSQPAGQRHRRSASQSQADATEDRAHASRLFGGFNQALLADSLLFESELPLGYTCFERLHVPSGASGMLRYSITGGVSSTTHRRGVHGTGLAANLPAPSLASTWTPSRFLSFRDYLLGRMGIEQPRTKRGPAQVGILVRTNRRRLTGLEAVGASLSHVCTPPRCHIHTLSFDSIPVSQQVVRVMDLDVLIGVNGAGLYHALWMPEGSVVIEISFPRLVDPVYRFLCQNLGLKHHLVFGEHVWKHNRPDEREYRQGNIPPLSFYQQYFTENDVLVEPEALAAVVRIALSQLPSGH